MNLKQNVLAVFFCVGALMCSLESSASTNEDEHHCLALALYWEARGETDAGMIAVGWTILNRVASPDFPDTPCKVIYQGGEKPPCQFSWWCDGKSDKPRSQKSWVKARLVAADLLTNPPSDPTKGALFYHSSGITGPLEKDQDSDGEGRKAHFLSVIPETQRCRANRPHFLLTDSK